MKHLNKLFIFSICAMGSFAAQAQAESALIPASSVLTNGGKPISIGIDIVTPTNNIINISETNDYQTTQLSEIQVGIVIQRSKLNFIIESLKQQVFDAQTAQVTQQITLDNAIIAEQDYANPNRLIIQSKIAPLSELQVLKDQSIIDYENSFLARANSLAAFNARPVVCK